jgi:hypothetical protein
MAENTKLPEFVSAIAKFFNWPPVIKMDFPQVGMRFYPLRADIVRLQAICDAYLNFLHSPDDRPPVYFKPALPFVMLQTVNYDKLEIEKIGWLTQHEAIFSIPVEWYEWKVDRWVFKDWGMTYPFLYLDHPISIWIGREMYGWPKVPVRVPRLFPLRNPPDPQGRVAFDLATHSRDRVNQPEPYRPFIEIRQDADSLSPTSWSAGDPYSMWPRAISGGLAAASTIVEQMADFFLRKPGRDATDLYQSMLGGGLNYITKWLPEFWTMMMPGAPRDRFTPSPFMKNNIVLKQFRDAREIDSACYQALVKSEISINRLIGAGVLFNPFSGDTSGGVTVRLHSIDTQPVVQALGLEVTEITQEHGGFVSHLKPFCPFWWSLDLSYGSANVICWRSKATKFSGTEDPGAPATHRNDYVKVGSGALEEVAGVEKIPNFLMRVMPLKADIAQLKKLCAELFKDVPYTIEPCVPYVLMIADQFRHRTSSDDPKQAWADSELRFVVVAKCRDPRSDGAERVVILPLLNFVGTEWNAISQREVNGRFALASEFNPPLQHGMQDLPPVAAPAFHRLFSLRTSICPSLDENEQTRRWTLIDLDAAAAPPSPPAAPSDELPEWLNELGLAGIAAEQKLTGLSLKQFRDAQFADHACYQALVQVERTFDAQPEFAWIREPLRISIHEFDTMQIKDTFGLLGGVFHPGPDGRKRDVFVPERPFWIRGDMEQSLGVNLCWRAGAMEWQRDK